MGVVDAQRVLAAAGERAAEAAARAPREFRGTRRKGPESLDLRFRPLPPRPFYLPGFGHGWFSGVNKSVGADLLAGLSDIRQTALAKLKEEAYALGCNAVIGVDFDYLTMDPETATSSGGTLYLPFLFAVTANGTAVVLEKN
nr:heavy metal-binding domain-containing protein [Arthrobacter sp. zg-Y20]